MKMHENARNSGFFMKMQEFSMKKCKKVNAGIFHEKKMQETVRKCRKIL